MALVLILFKKIRFPIRNQIEIRYEHRVETRDFIVQYFEEHNIKVGLSNFSVYVHDDHRVYTNTYYIDLPRGVTYPQIADDLCENKNIRQITLLNI